MTKRIMLVVAYDGTGYSGFQAQKSGAPTIEGELNRALTDLTAEPVQVSGASRTDAGVHARCNLAVFDTQSRIPPEKFAHALNVRLPDRIRVTASMEMPADFHPRFCSTAKTYEYRIYNAPMPDPLRRLYTFFSRYRFDVDKMREAAQYLVGEHDFKSFCSTYSSAKTTVREILSIDVEEAFSGRTGKGTQTEDHCDRLMRRADCDRHKWEVDPAIGLHTEAPKCRLQAVDPACRMPREIVIRVRGRGFLYNMVRIIAGTLMEVGRGAKAPDEAAEILRVLDRRAAGPTAPACGLTLTKYEILEKGFEMSFE